MLRGSGAARGQAGFGLIELLVGITILAVGMALAVPAFGDWQRNARLRASAEAVQAGLYYARAEAVRRNALVRFQLTTSLDSACALSTSGPEWLVSLAKGSTSPEGGCGSGPDDSSEPYILQRSSTISSRNLSTLSADRSLLGFDGLGRLSTLSGATSRGTYTLDIAASSGSCVKSGGTVQCLRLVVSPAGQITLCDPAHTGSADPLTCPADS